MAAAAGEDEVTVESENERVDGSADSLVGAIPDSWLRWEPDALIEAAGEDEVTVESENERVDGSADSLVGAIPDSWLRLGPDAAFIIGILLTRG
ncbi:hypothetical protein AC578_2988 [Pseudocercospora eumusae]|uniref:Uncharacterized protein n=1 Tax=Pseudocercospora eumusae TaxID=321146 RepID=A0A139HEB0_9PEZI|nr:hypothetical protein AC578_2988 [Pseudocercospora eumusae]